MSWVKASQQIEGHWKLQDLCLKTGWDPDQAIGKLLRFWWWVQNYAEDGDLSRFSAPQIDLAMRLPAGTNFLEILSQTKWVDTAPYMRVHDWWDHAGPWLQAKYKQYPEKWELIKRRYKSENRVNGSTNRKRTAKEPTNKTRLDVTREEKEKAVTASHARGPETAPDRTQASPGLEPVLNRSNNGSFQAAKNQSEDLEQVLEFMRENMPAGGAHPDLSAEWEGHTLPADTDRYRENGMKAAWKLFTDPKLESYAFARGQHFSTREFLRQIPALTDLPDYVNLNRRYREAIMKRFSTARETAPAEV